MKFIKGSSQNRLYERKMPRWAKSKRDICEKTVVRLRSPQQKLILRTALKEVIVWKIEEIKKHHPPNPPSPKHNPLHKGDNYLPNKKVAPPN